MKNNKGVTAVAAERTERTNKTKHPDPRRSTPTSEDSLTRVDLNPLDPTEPGLQDKLSHPYPQTLNCQRGLSRLTNPKIYF